MRKIIIFLLLGFLSMLIVLYALSWSDLISNKMLTDDVSVNFAKSFKDYFASLYYFRYIILIGSIILALLFYGLRIGFAKLRR
jgi:hypothetical protein